MFDWVRRRDWLLLSILIVGAVLIQFATNFPGLTGVSFTFSVVGFITMVASFLLILKDYGSAPDTGETYESVEDPPLARFLFESTRSALLWFVVRVFLGAQWLDAGMHKVTDPAWVGSGTALRSYWERAVAIPEQGRPPITYDWYRAFLQFMLENQTNTWFSWIVAFGETLIGLGLIVGALVGVAAFFGILLNFSFLLAGTTSTNPVLLIIGIILLMAWKVAGHWGLDRLLLPKLGVPWRPNHMQIRS